MYTPALYFAIVWEHQTNAVYCGLNAYLYCRSRAKQLCNEALLNKNINTMQLCEQFMFGLHINKSMIDQETDIKIDKTSHGFCFTAINKLYKYLLIINCYNHTVIC